MEGLFNNREVAAAVWLSILLVSGLCWEVTRKSALDILKAFFTPKLLIPLLLSFLPAVVVVIVLARLGWWDASVLKETLYWFIGTGLVMFSSFTKVQSLRALFKKTVKEVLALAVIIEFFVGFYVFPLWIELLLLPLAVFAILLATAAKYQKIEGIELTRRFLNGLVVTIGLAVLFFATLEFIHNPKPLFTYQNLELFLLPVVLSLAYMPSVYLIALYSEYELAFNRINYLMSGDSRDKWVLKFTCIKQCRLSIYKTNELIRYLAVTLTIKTTSNQALQLIKEFSPKRSI